MFSALQGEHSNQSDTVPPPPKDIFPIGAILSDQSRALIIVTVMLFLSYAVLMFLCHVVLCYAVPMFFSHVILCYAVPMLRCSYVLMLCCPCVMLFLCSYAMLFLCSYVVLFLCYAVPLLCCSYVLESSVDDLQFFVGELRRLTEHLQSLRLVSMTVRCHLNLVGVTVCGGK